MVGNLPIKTILGSTLLALCVENFAKFKNLLLTNKFLPAIITLVVKNEYTCESGGIGIRARLRCVWETMRVQVPPLAPTKRTIPFGMVLLLFVTKGT